jgi:hypothetical protein
MCTYLSFIVHSPLSVCASVKSLNLIALMWPFWHLLVTRVALKVKVSVEALLNLFVFILRLLQDKSTAVFRNVCNYSNNDTASHPRRTGSSATLL